jgi:uncharacterized protein (TIGR03437 family)
MVSFLRLPLLGALLLFPFISGAQAQQPLCLYTSTAAPVHSEGLAEPVGNIVVNCSGGTVGSTVSLSLYISLNTNITNRLDSNSQPTGISVTGASVGSFSLSSPATLIFNAVNYTAAAAPTTITISGILAAVAPLANGTTPAIVTATLAGAGAQFPPASILQAGISSATLLSSQVNNGVPCNGSPVPATLDFPTFAATSGSSELRITEANATSFTAKAPGADAGLRIVVSITGYGSANVYVPDVIVGNSGTTPTTAGAYSTQVNGGTWTPGTPGQLLLIRVNGADANGAGGSLAFSKPAVVTTFISMTRIPLTAGAGTVTYEVVEASPLVQESAHIPVFVTVAPTTCPTTLTPKLSAMAGPVSKVMTATTTDPIPRFAPIVPAIDCGALFDCSSYYFPALTVGTMPINLAGSSLGGPQSSFFGVGNTGSGILNFTTSITYTGGGATGWLSVSPSSGSNNVSVQAIANPATLAPGTYTANISVGAGSYYVNGVMGLNGVAVPAVVPVTFTVGPVGVTVQNVGNAASFTYGTVAPGSYAVLYGLNLVSGTATPKVTFNGIAATVVYSSATQINLIVPASLAGQSAATVLVTAGGMVSNSFKVTLAANAPGIFNPGVINVANSSINSASNPAARGSYISIYLTGLSTPVTGATVNIGTQTGLTPQYAGAQPTLPALDQVNVLVPASLPATPNPVPVQVCVAGACSNQINLYIQ